MLRRILTMMILLPLVALLGYCGYWATPPAITWGGEPEFKKRVENLVQVSQSEAEFVRHLSRYGLERSDRPETNSAYYRRFMQDCFPFSGVTPSRRPQANACYQKYETEVLPFLPEPQGPARRMMATSYFLLCAGNFNVHWIAEDDNVVWADSSITSACP